MSISQVLIIFSIDSFVEIMNRKNMGHMFTSELTTGVDILIIIIRERNATEVLFIPIISNIFINHRLGCK